MEGISREICAWCQGWYDSDETDAVNKELYCSRRCELEDEFYVKRENADKEE